MSASSVRRLSLSSPWGRCFHQSSAIFSGNPGKNNAVSSSATTTGDALRRDGGRSKENSYEHFPWRDKPLDILGAGNSLWKKACIFHSKYTLNKLLERDKVLLKDMVDGGEAAFQCAVSSIFQHSLMVKHQYGADAVPSQYIKHPGETNIQEIFAPELTDFFLRAIQRHCLNPAHACTYTLHKIERAALADMEVLIGARRGQPLPKNAHRTRIFHTSMFLTISEETSARAFMEDVGKFSTERNVSIRVAVDVQCEGNCCTAEILHYVSTALTQQILIQMYPPQYLQRPLQSPML